MDLLFHLRVLWLLLSVVRARSWPRTRSLGVPGRRSSQRSCLAGAIGGLSVISDYAIFQRNDHLPTQLCRGVVDT